MINKVILIGNLGNDPELRFTQSGKQVANFSLATTERWRDQAGNQQEQTEWHKCVAWGRLAEICGQYLAKGSRVYIEGKLQTRKWQDQSGQDRYTTEIVASEMKMLGGGREQGGNGQQQPGQAQYGGAPRQQSLVGDRREPPAHNPPGYDDVPF